MVSMSQPLTFLLKATMFNKLPKSKHFSNQVLWTDTELSKLHNILNQNILSEPKHSHCLFLCSRRDPHKAIFLILKSPHYTG